MWVRITRGLKRKFARFPMFRIHPEIQIRTFIAHYPFRTFYVLFRKCAVRAKFWTTRWRCLLSVEGVINGFSLNRKKHTAHQVLILAAKVWDFKRIPQGKNLVYYSGDGLLCTHKRLGVWAILQRRESFWQSVKVPALLTCCSMTNRLRPIRSNIDQSSRFSD